MNGRIHRQAHGWMNTWQKEALGMFIKSTGEHLWQFHLSLLLPLLAHPLWAQPISPGFQAYLNAYEMVQRLHRESEAGSWSQPRMPLSQEITGICTFLEASHSTTWWRLQDTSCSHTPQGPSPGFSKGLCQLFSLIVTHWAQCQAHSRYTMKVYWTEMKFPTVPCCM